MFIFRSTGCTTEDHPAWLTSRLCWWGAFAFLESKAAHSLGLLRAPFSSLGQGWPFLQPPSAATAATKMTSLMKGIAGNDVRLRLRKIV